MKKFLLVFAMLCMCLSATTTAFAQRKNEAVDTSWMYRLSGIILHSIDETRVATSEYRPLYFDGALKGFHFRNPQREGLEGDAWYPDGNSADALTVGVQTSQGRTTLHVGDAEWEVVGNSDSTRRFVWLDTTRIEPTLVWNGSGATPQRLEKVYDPSAVSDDFTARTEVAIVAGPRNAGVTGQAGPLGFKLGRPYYGLDITLPLSRQRGKQFSGYAGIAYAWVWQPTEDDSDAGYSFWGVRVYASLRSRNAAHVLQGGLILGHKLTGIGVGTKLAIPELLYTYFPVSWMGVTTTAAAIPGNGVLFAAGLRFRVADKKKILPQ